MKKKIISLISVVLVAASLSACKKIENKENLSMPINPVITKITEKTGVFTVYDYGKIKLHAYATNDPLNDEVYILENDKLLVGIEMPSFTKNLEEWKEYIISLNKPMKDIFIADHPTGASYVKGVNIYGTADTKNSIEYGSVSNITKGLSQVFGKDFHGENDIIKINKIINEGKILIGGIKFNIIQNGSSYDIEIPEINAIHTHMLGKTTHSIIVSPENMNYMLSVLKNYQDRNYNLILSAHSEPENQDAVTEKINYIRTVKNFSEKYSTKQEFIYNMKKEFPNYSGENYLEMTAGYLYK